MLKLTVVTATLSFNVLPLTLATAMLNVNVLPLKCDVQRVPSGLNTYKNAMRCSELIRACLAPLAP